MLQAVDNYLVTKHRLDEHLHSRLSIPGTFSTYWDSILAETDIKKRACVCKTSPPVYITLDNDEYELWNPTEDDFFQKVVHDNWTTVDANHPHCHQLLCNQNTNVNFDALSNDFVTCMRHLEPSIGSVHVLPVRIMACAPGQYIHQNTNNIPSCATALFILRSCLGASLVVDDQVVQSNDSNKPMLVCLKNDIKYEMQPVIAGFCLVVEFQIFLETTPGSVECQFKLESELISNNEPWEFPMLEEQLIFKEDTISDMFQTWSRNWSCALKNMCEEVGQCPEHLNGFVLPMLYLYRGEAMSANHLKGFDQVMHEVLKHSYGETNVVLSHCTLACATNKWTFHIPSCLLTKLFPEFSSKFISDGRCGKREQYHGLDLAHMWMFGSHFQNALLFHSQDSVDFHDVEIQESQTTYVGCVFVVRCHTNT